MKKYIGLSIVALSMLFTACDDYLDKLPDNRMDNIKTADDISSLLVSAYANRHPAYILEMSSDNADLCDNTGWTEYDRFQRQAWQWDDVTEIGSSDCPQDLWEAYYTSVAASNTCLTYLESLGTEERAALAAQEGEALICRAYNMFVLSTVFCNAYNKSTASTELGLPYPKETEKTVGEMHDRGTLEQLYNNIDADLQRGLPLIKSTYTNPKFHFTADAAYAVNIDGYRYVIDEYQA